MRIIPRLSCLAILLPLAANLVGTADAATTVPFTNAFFPFCIDWHDAKKRTMEQQAEMLKELGYDGMGHIWLDKLPERLKTLDAAGLKLYQITIQVTLEPGKPAYDARLKEMMPLLKGRNVQFDLLISGFKPSDPAGDSRGVEVIKEIAAIAKTADAQVLLYPHVDNWTERFEDCLRVANKVNEPNVGVMFNLCHWLRVSKDRDYASLLEKARPRLYAVSLNGADEFDDQPGWAHYIQPLGSGSFNVLKLLKTLQKLGYTGPIGLQCYGIGGDTREHLAQSLKTWREYCRELEKP
jgi:sugar phosphate isomerase/epimerase